MGRKTSANVEEKRKQVRVRPIERLHAGKVVAVYALLEELIAAYHQEVAGARFVLLWRDGWKPDVDKVLKMARCKKATEVDRAVLGALDGVEDYPDFVIQLNADAWPGLSDAKKRQWLDHELYHAAPDLDRNGKQKLDSKERLCWRTRKCPIMEFPEIVQRYGVAEVLNLKDSALGALDTAQRPLLAAMEKVSGDNGENAAGLTVGLASADPKDRGEGFVELREKKIPDWRQLSVNHLDLPKRSVKAIFDKGIYKLGALSKHIEEQGDFWAREIKNLGPGGRRAVEDAFIKFWSDHPEYCKPETTAATA